MKNLWMSWSSGKDSAYALLKLLKNSDYRVTGIFTSVNVEYDRVAMHSTRADLLRRQADALGLPLKVVALPARCTNEIYEEKMGELIIQAKREGVSAMGFGDLFLGDIRSYRERQLAGSGIEPVFPLWGMPTSLLAEKMIDGGIGAVLTCVDPSRLMPDFAGRYFDRALLRDLPPGADPCGENGEFHTFVFSCPAFKKVIDIGVGEKVEREGFIFADVIAKQ